MTQIEAYRGGEACPEGVFEWRIKAHEIGTREVMDKDTKQKIARAIVAITLEALACRVCKDPAIDRESLVGIEHTEMFFIKDLVKDMGRVQAFLEDAGIVGKGSLNKILDQNIGHEFVSAIKHRKDKKDTSIAYAHIEFKTVQPLAPAQGAAAGGLATATSEVAPASTPTDAAPEGGTIVSLDTAIAAADTPAPIIPATKPITI